MVTVTALKSFAYETRQIQAGEACEVRPIDAAILARRGYVSLTRVARASLPIQPTPPKRRYRRRDLVAE